MAANTLASIAAATAAGYKLERTVQPASIAQPLGSNITKLGKQVTGVQGQGGRYVEFAGESTVSSAAADTAALANLNKWRDNRYGSDSATASVSQVQDAATSPSTQGVVPTHRSMTKDTH